MTVIESIHQHRSIRKYKPDPVPDEILREILEAGIRAPSAGNLNAYSIIVTRDRAMREKLYAPLREQSMVLEAPVFITICADFNRTRKWLKVNNAPDSYDGLMSFLAGAIDAILVAQNVTLAAESKGLGCCHLGSTLSNCDQIGEILNLPRCVVPVMGFCMGYPDEAPSKRSRLPYEGLVHEECYHDYTDDQIKAIYHDREVEGWQKYMDSPELRKLVKEKGIENLAHAISKLRYSREYIHLTSNRVLDYLKAQDFFNQ
ncbi:MAG: nitroreductase family protein [Anaerolineales bacterium]|jgi:nitroreductase